ncbi:transient receptor potential cation channel subfamily A member 1-like [Clavelina lepadiformis]|uniref:transient receptor potential cation channel subfamily A member 1-like n=1 Tax=Clavelina lepadiformis TaxID=159417 RepID=UPI00404109EF
MHATFDVSFRQKQKITKSRYSGKSTRKQLYRTRSRMSEEGPHSDATERMDMAIQSGNLAELMQILSALSEEQKVLYCNTISKLGGLTLLHVTARRGDAKATELLLQCGAKVNSRDKEGKLPIHHAVKFFKSRHRTTFQQQKTTKDSSNRFITDDNSLKCLCVLLDHGAYVNGCDKYQSTPLHYACNKGHLDAVELLLESKDLMLEVYDDNGSSPLHEASKGGHHEVVDILLSKTGDNMQTLISVQDKNGYTALLLACREGHTEVAKAILLSLKNPSNLLSRMLERDFAGNTCLHFAVESGQVEMVKLLLKIWDETAVTCESTYMHKNKTTEKYVDLKRLDGYTALHLAVDARSLEILKVLFEKDPCPHACDEDLVTPLHLAAQHNHKECMEFLLSRKSPIDARDRDNFTPLLTACKMGNMQVVQSLLDHGASLYACDHSYNNCLMLAVKEGHFDVVQILLSSPGIEALLCDTDLFGNSLLHISTLQGDVNIFKILLNAGIKCNVHNDLEQTPLHLAAMEDNVDIIFEIITTNRVTIFDEDEKCRTPLHIASLYGCETALEKLIELGANPKDIDADSCTALHLCVSEKGGLTCAKILLKTESTLIDCKTADMETVLHLACYHGNDDLVKLFLEYDADVTVRLSDGRNPLDVALDERNESCARTLIEHVSWKRSLSNALLCSGPGRITTPFRKMIDQLPDVAELVMTKCMSDNGARIEDSEYKIAYNFEFLEDTYLIAEWRRQSESQALSASTFANQSETHKTSPEIVETQFTNMAYTNEEKGITRQKTNRYNRKAQKDLMPWAVELRSDEIYGKNGKLNKQQGKPYVNKSSTLSENHPMHLMVEHNCPRLLSHPLVNCLANHKWKHVRYIYWSNLCGYLIYLILLNIYMCTTPPRFAINSTLARTDFENGVHCIRVIFDAQSVWGSACQNNRSGFRYTTTVLVISFSSIQLFKEILQFLHHRYKYFLDPLNYLEVVLYSLSILVFVNTDSLAQDTGIREVWQWQCGAFIILLAWINLVLYVRHTGLGVYLFMFRSVTYSFMQFALIVLVFLVGFSLSFYVLLQNQYEFDTPLTSMVKSLVMMIGEFDYSSIFLSQYTSSSYADRVNYEESTYLIFVVFLVMMSLLMTNLLVGIAVDDISLVQRNAAFKRQAELVENLLNMEFALPEFIRRRWVIRERIVQPNKYKNRHFFIKLLMEEKNLKASKIDNFLHPYKTENQKLQEEINSLKETVCLLTKSVQGLKGNERL